MAALEAHLKARTDAVKADCSEAGRRRFDESVGIFSGRARVYNQEPLLLHYPRLGRRHGWRLEGQRPAAGGEG